MAALGLTPRDVYLVHDELTGQTWRWGQHAFVRLTHDDPAHVLTLIRYGSRSTHGPTARGSPGQMIGLPDTQVADQVMAYITAARWFAGKGRLASLRSLTPLPWLNEVSDFFAGRAPAVRMEIAQVEYAVEEDAAEAAAAEDPAWAGGPRQAVTPMRTVRASSTSLRSPTAPHPTQTCTTPRSRGSPIPSSGPVVAYDAARDPEACRVLLRALLSESRLADRDTTLRFHLTGREGLTADLEPRVFTGQQSNTSVMLGDVAIVKLFRRLELGRNLDIEVHDALNRAGLEDVAGLFGWAEGSWNAEGVTCDADLAMVVEKLSRSGRRVGRWPWTRSGPAPASPRRPEALGRALAETHAALQQAFPTVERLRGGGGEDHEGPADGGVSHRARAAALSRGVGPPVRRAGRR